MDGRFGQRPQQPVQRVDRREISDAIDARRTKMALEGGNIAFLNDPYSLDAKVQVASR